MKATLRHIGGAVLLALLAVPAAAATPDLRLIEATRHGDTEAVRALLTQRVDVNEPQGDGATALHWAAHRGDVETASLLIDAGARVDVANAYGVTPLSLACLSQHASLALKLLEAGADPNTAEGSGETPLMTCARTGAVEAMRGLLARGANVNAREHRRGQTALMWAAAQGHAEVVRILVEAGADVQTRSRATRQLVATASTTSGARGTEAETEFGGFTPLLFVARNGHLESARILIAAGADVNDAAADGTSALVVASHSGHAGLAEFLLEQGADPNAAGSGYTALHAAVLRGDAGLVTTLLDRGANVNARITKTTPIPRASQHYLFTQQSVGATPFFLAAKYAETGLMRLLAARGADLLAMGRDDTTPLLAAAGSQWASGTEDRRERALDPEALDVLRYDEAHTLEAVKLAVALGGAVHAANSTGKTALHVAAEQGWPGVIQFLVDTGAKVNVRDGKSNTPLKLAKGLLARHAAQAAALLEKLGGTE